MITPGDDYPLHQTSRPVRDPGTDRNAYDRFFFNGYPRSADAYFALAFGLYPGRNIMDAGFSAIVDGVQHNVRASRLLGDDRLDTQVGPIRVTIVEPLRRLRVEVDDPESGLRAELEFTARAPAFEESPYVWKPGYRVVFDYTRLTQNGTWSGSLTAPGGRTLAVEPDTWWGTRDRSWGSRPVGEREQGAPEGPRGFYWLWAPVQFDDACYLWDVNENPDGEAWHSEALWSPVGVDAPVERGTASYHFDYTPGTRHAAAFELRLTFPSGGRTLELEPIFPFFMQGIGYTHPTQGHGMFVGEQFRAAESFITADMDEANPFNQHIQALCRVRRDDGAEGIGILEQLVIGPHQPSGLTDLLDMHP
ncbi:MAG: hypothetical protein QOG64_498 [Acidimicrobiaceae bacterium]|nr:hypothetical protein [Acidimicrobiaceae bacterium]